MDKLEAISRALAEIDEAQSLTLVKAALDANVPAIEILNACQKGMVEVGSQFECGEYFVSELMMSGEIFKQISALLQPQLAASGVKTAGKVVMGTVQGDIHTIGKDIVCSMLRSANLEVIDLGVDVRPERFVAALQESGSRVLGMSGLLTLAFGAMKETITAVTAAGLREQVKIMIGGGPIDAKVCEVVGADGWGADALQAVRLAKGWTEPGMAEVANG